MSGNINGSSSSSNRLSVLQCQIWVLAFWFQEYLQKEGQREKERERTQTREEKVQSYYYGEMWGLMDTAGLLLVLGRDREMKREKERERVLAAY